VKTARLRGIFLVQSGTNGSFTEQSSGSFITQMGQTGLFLETIIPSVLTRKLSAIANNPAHNFSKPEFWTAAPRTPPGFVNDAPTKPVSGYL
jgi:hypothetical protein